MNRVIRAPRPTRRRHKLLLGARDSRKRGIALFMVMGAIAMLTILMTELTYSTKMNEMMSYNFRDNLQAFYLAKAALKLCEVRLKAYASAKNLLDTQFKDAKGALPPGLLDKIWSQPIMFPLPLPKEASIADTDAINDFFKKSSLPGNFTASIIGESNRLNLNLLFGPSSIPGPSGASGASGGSGASGAIPPTTGSSGASGASGGSGSMQFRPALLDAISSALEQKRQSDREFYDTYRNVQAEDIVEAIEYYIFPDKPVSNLPGFKAFKPKLLPFFTLSELHLIPGIDDTLYDLLAGILTVYSTPGLNINTMNKGMLLSLIPELTPAEADDVLRSRDDPDVGQPWQSADDFWKAVGNTSVAHQIDTVKARLSTAGISLITDELSFKVSVLANVGLSTRRLEAWLILNPAVAAGASGASGASGSSGYGGSGTAQGASGASGYNGNGGGIPGTQDASGKAQATGLSLIYWRML